MDLHHFPIIDTHSHFFKAEFEEHELSSVLSLSLKNLPVEQRKNSLLYQWFIQELAYLLECFPEEEQVLSKRRERMIDDYQGYVSELFKRGNIKGMVVDTGYNPADVDEEAFENIVPAQTKYLFRIEAVVDDIWKKRPTFLRGVELFDETLAKQIKKDNYIGLKSAIGYRTGLDVGPVSEEQARQAYREGREKEVRDFFLRRSLAFCRDNNIPLQIHTGFGESSCNLFNNNPLLLRGLIEEDAFKDVKIILVHGGYPYTFEAGYLCGMYPNIYCDVSEFVTMVPLGTDKGLSDLFNMSPFTKIMFGSDGFIIPEIYWFAANVFRRKLSALLQGIVAQGMLDEDYALTVAEMALSGNATDIYGFTF